MLRRTLLLTLALAACKPTVGRAPSLITEPEILAVRSLPAEAKPGDPVAYDLLVVSPEGTVSDPVAAWDVCSQPKPPAESNSVAAGCVTAAAGEAQGATFAAPVPTDACMLFGPMVPKQDFRPRDPDSTGGYYLPVRAVLSNLGDRVLTAFAMERITCSLPNASPAVIQDYSTRYQANQNPKLAGLVVQTVDGTTVDLAGGSVTVSSGGLVTLNAAFTPESAETYVVFDPEAQALVDRRESMRLAWFASDGEFDHDRTGRAESEPETTSDNTWTAPVVSAPTPVYLWLVLRDSRGGVDFAAYDLSVIP
jgi:hypothetical protein